MPIGVIDQNIGDSLSAAQGFVNTVRQSLFNIISAVEVSRFNKSYVGSGVQGPLGKSLTTGASVTSIPTITDAFAGLYPHNYNVGSMTPKANVIVKKRMFTTLAHNEDVRFMDSNERAFIRTSKNLFQLKAFQIATYEALTKFETTLKQDKIMYIPSVLSALQNAFGFGAISDTEFSSMQSTLLQITQRDLAGEDTNFTTWFIDQFDMDLANVGRGVGVIEFTNFSSINTSNKIDGDSGSADITFEDPYHIMLISNDDIEAAIRGALFDSFTSTLLPALVSGDMRGLADSLQNQTNLGNPVTQAQTSAAINSVQQKAFDILNQQPLSPDNISIVRKKMRKFYLGKAVIQPTDGLHVFLKSDTIYENDEDPVGLPLGLDRFGVDEEILKQEMYAVTKDRNFDISLYKTLRDKNAFTGASVFVGVVEKVTDNFSEGYYTLSINAKNNLWYLEQSFINTEPALDQSQGFLHDPLTQFDFEFDSFGNVKTTDANGNSGFKLSQDNIDRLDQINFTHESGSLRGSAVTQNNIVNGTSPGTDIQQAEHFPGMLYKWKEGIASVSVAMNTADPTGLFFNTSREAANNTIGLNITSTPFDNLDAANVVSLLVTGQPYNISTFVNDSVITGVTNSLATKNSSDASSYFSSFFDIVSRQNKTLGNFKPILNGASVGIDAIKKLAYKKVSFTAIDQKIGALEDQIFTARQQLNGLPLNISGGDNNLLVETRHGLQAKIDALTVEENALINQFQQISADISSIGNNQDALGFSTDPEQREAQIIDYQYHQLYVANRRIEDVRYNRDINYFIVGTEYDADLDIQAFTTEMRGGFKYFDNKYEPAISKVREATKAIDFEIFADNSGNIRFRPPQYNKVPLSVYYELFRRKGQQGIDILPDFVKNLFVDHITSAHENIVQMNWQMLIELGKSGDNSLINALNASVGGDGIIKFLGYTGTNLGPANQGSNSQSIIIDGDTTTQMIEFTSADQANVDRNATTSKVADANLTLDVLQTIAVQLEKRFGTARILITQDDIINANDVSAPVKRKALFTKLRGYSSKRNAAIKSYLSQLDSLKISTSDITTSNGSAGTQTQITQAVTDAVAAKQEDLAQQIFQVVSTGNIQGYTRPTISSEFTNLIEDDSRNLIGRGSGRRFIVRDDSIISFKIEESQPEYCRINVNGQQNFGGKVFGPSVMEGRTLWAGAVDYDLWRMYGFKTGADKTVPYLSNPESQLKPYAVFLLLKQHRMIMRGSITVIGNEYYQLGDVIYLASRDMIFYVTGISHSYSEGTDFTTILTIEYGRPPGEYIPTPLDVIGKTLLKQNTSSLSITRRQLNPDTFYYPLRPSPTFFLDGVSSGNIDNTERMLRMDSNQGRLVNALMNANTALQKPNAVLVISGFTTGSINDGDVQTRIDTVKQWFTAPKLIGSSLQGQTLIDLKDYSAIPANKIVTKTVDLAANNKTSNTTNTNTDIVASDQSIINTIGDVNLEFGIKNACQEVHAFVKTPADTKDTVPLVIEVGIFFKKA